MLFNIGVNGGAFTKLQEFVTMVKSFAMMHHTKSAFDLATLIATSSGILKDLYADKTPEGVSRYENIQELLNAIKEFTEAAPPNEDGELSFRSLGEFMEDVSLLTDVDNDKDDENNNDKVSLMTIHSAKGLEFPYVYIVGLEENLFPSQMALNAREDLEEERRLFYVALTRAEKRATLSFAETRYRWGQLVSAEPSRFIEEIEDKFIDSSAILKSKNNKLEGELFLKTDIFSDQADDMVNIIEGIF